MSMTAIERLTFTEQIRTLKARYFRSVDSRDWVGYAAVFTLSATLEVIRTDGETVKYSGVDAIVSRVKEFLHGARSVHHGFMPEINIQTAHTASGIWMMEDLLSWSGRRFHGFGHYYEQYTREPEQSQWRIDYCRLVRARLDWT
jgi:hypothetical protein